ncbi:hypothetical protein LB572_17370 [Mesorhizobium sp. BH1-1-5]|uniref:hypothetical protein n=1 Tax=Mesorhizobium sp. BH1-1-5 TaxID=2876661 RepID=UPI001CCD4CBF|nr:hypothetical protein [Mesorhizobium sp. BH1-1-5]MBZ9988870.1 hypothetical protein [Mesorhizobium sp. BH1-1-5]
MTAVEFPGPGFTAEQWNQINALATSLRPGQGLWLSGSASTTSSNSGYGFTIFDVDQAP